MSHMVHSLVRGAAENIIGGGNTAAILIAAGAGAG